MNLELVEERCLKFLSETANPLASLGELLAFCRREKSLAALTAQDLLAFARRHELMRVIDPPGSADDDPLTGGSDTFQEPRIILNSRIPSPRELGQMMIEQMTKMTDALGAALVQAEASGDRAAVTQLRQALERAQSLRERIDQLS